MSPRKGWGIGKKEYNFRYNYPLSLSETNWPTWSEIDESVRGAQRADRESWQSHKGTTALAEFDLNRLRNSKALEAYNEYWQKRVFRYELKRRRQEWESFQQAMQAEWRRRRELLVKNVLLEQERLNREATIQWFGVGPGPLEPPPE